jgi:transposase
MSGWNSASHNKYLLQYHLIYVIDRDYNAAINIKNKGIEMLKIA